MTSRSIFNPLLLSMLMLLSASSIFAQGIVFHDGDWLSALEKAGRENKLIFMDAYTTWCGPCKMMDKQTFVDSAVGALYNDKFINVKMNMEKGVGIELARTYNVQAYPTLLFLDPAGQIVHRVAGFHLPGQFIDLAKTALDPNRKMMALDEQYATGDRNADFLYTYAYMRMNAMDGTHYPVAVEYLATQKDWSTAKNLEFVFAFAEYIDGDLFRYLIDNRSTFQAHYGSTPVIRKMDEVISMANFLNEPDWQSVESLLTTVYPGESERQLAYFKMNYFQQSGRIAEYTSAALAFYEAYPAEDADALNEAAWSFYEHVEDPKALQQALQWSKQAVKWSDSYYNNDTLAALYFKLGKKSKAKKTALHAIELARESGQDFSLTQQLLDQL